MCYDLRFPVFSRNKTIHKEKEYDAIIYVANWPEVRADIWSILLKARAIENQTFCIGLNRVGKDGHQVSHSGNSTVINPWGENITNLTQSVNFVEIITLKKNEITVINNKFPAFLDADNFHLTDK